CASTNSDTDHWGQTVPAPPASGAAVRPRRAFRRQFQCRMNRRIAAGNNSAEPPNVQTTRAHPPPPKQGQSAEFFVLLQQWLIATGRRYVVRFQQSFPARPESSTRIPLIPAW